jgi:hypothetical protein
MRTTHIKAVPQKRDTNLIDQISNQFAINSIKISLSPVLIPEDARDEYAL